MRRPQNLKKQQLPSVWTKQLFLHSRRVGDFFKYLWPFQKSSTLLKTYLPRGETDTETEKFIYLFRFCDCSQNNFLIDSK